MKPIFLLFVFFPNMLFGQSNGKWAFDRLKQLDLYANHHPKKLSTYKNVGPIHPPQYFYSCASFTDYSETEVLKPKRIGVSTSCLLQSELEFHIANPLGRSNTGLQRSRLHSPEKMVSSLKSQFSTYYNRDQNFCDQIIQILKLTQDLTSDWTTVNNLKRSQMGEDFDKFSFVRQALFYQTWISNQYQSVGRLCPRIHEDPSFEAERSTIVH